MSEETTRRCSARPSGFREDVVCQLEEGHNSPHRALGGDLTWEPLYAADARRLAQDRLEALQAAVDLLRTAPNEWGREERDTYEWLQGGGSL